MNSLANSLRCLKHPAALFSIGLLLLNDHVLKVAVPSWLTGKLSDFAGLFFFPFVLAATLSIVTDRLRISPRKLGWLAFGITAVWFAAMKTTVWGNALTEDLLARLLGFPAQIVLDPTDLIALPMLIPAWRLWNRAEVTYPSRAGWIALGVASLAVLATTPLPAIPVVRSVTSQDGAVYASLEYGDGQVYARSVAKSMDGGRTWARVNGPMPPSSEHQNGQPLCDFPTTQMCYRTAKEEVDESTDGGNTWHVGWDIPSGRRDYMARRAAYPDVGLKQLDLGPYDLALADPVGQNGLHTLVVALGNDGVLVRSPEGVWKRYAVLLAQPTPFAAQSFDQAMDVVGDETDVLFLVAFVLFLVACIRSWRIVLARVSAQSEWKPSLRRTMAPLWGAFALSAILSIPIGFQIFGRGSWNLHLFTNLASFLMGMSVGILSSLPIPLILLWGIFLTWLNVKSIAKRPKAVWNAAGWCVITLIGIFPLAWLPILLWAFGVIPFYLIALLTSILITLFVVIQTWRRINQASQQAIDPTPYEL